MSKISIFVYGPTTLFMDYHKPRRINQELQDLLHQTSVMRFPPWDYWKRRKSWNTCTFGNSEIGTDHEIRKKYFDGSCCQYCLAWTSWPFWSVLNGNIDVVDGYWRQRRVKPWPSKFDRVIRRVDTKKMTIMDFMKFNHFINLNPNRKNFWVIFM